MFLWRIDTPCNFCFVQVRSAWVDEVQKQGLVPKFFEFLSLDHSNNNVHNIRLCRLVILAGNVRPKAMADLQVVPKVNTCCAPTPVHGVARMGMLVRDGLVDLD